MAETAGVFVLTLHLLVVAPAAANAPAAWSADAAQPLERVRLRRHHAVISERSSVVPDGHAPLLLERTLYSADGARVLRLDTDSERPSESAASAASAGWTRTPAEVRAVVEAQGVNTQGASLLPQRGPRGRRPGWRVRLRADPTTLSRPLVWVDDASLAVLQGPDQTRRSEAWAFDRNPLLDRAAQRFELDALPENPEKLADSRFDVRNCGDPGAPAFCVLEAVVPDAAGDFLFTPPASMRAADHERPDDLFAAGSIYVHADRFASFADAYQLPMPPCVEAGETGILLANYRGFTGRDTIFVANAGYTGDCELMAFFGQGPHADWGYDADVIRHELTHGVIASQMGPDRVLGRPALRDEAVVEDAGALGEALSDFVAAVMSGDPAHAEYTRAYDGGLARSADNDLQCPQALRGEIHADSEPMTGALWEASELLGPALVTPIVDAVAMLGEDATFEDASAAFLAVTTLELGEDAADVLRSALARHNLLDCERVVDADDAPTSLLLLPNSGASGRYEPMRPPPLQFRVDVPEGQTSMQMSFAVSVAPDPGWAPLGDVHALVRHGSPLAFSYETDARGVVMVDASPDLHIPNVAGPGAEEGTFSLDVTDESVVYVALFNQGLHRARVSALSVSFDDATSGGPESSSGGADTATSGPQGDTTSEGAPQAESTGGESSGAGTSADGSGCRLGGRADGYSLWALLLLYAGLIRRRQMWS